MPNPISNPQPSQSSIEIKPTQTRNGFSVASDQKSASREFVVNGRNLTITVYFPENSTSDQINSRLDNFSAQNLELLGAHAIALGLGRDSKKGKGKINAIAFKQDNVGQLSEAVKHFSNGSTPKVLSIKYYQDKIDAIQDTKNPKRAKLLAQKNTFERVQSFWQRLHNHAAAQQTQTPNPGQNVPGQQPSPANSKDEVEEIQNESDHDQPLKKTPASDPNNNAS